MRTPDPLFVSVRFTQRTGAPPMGGCHKACDWPDQLLTLTFGDVEKKHQYSDQSNLHVDLYITIRSANAWLASEKTRVFLSGH